MKKVALLVLLSLCLIGAKDSCGYAIPENIAEDNRSETVKDFDVVLLFEYDGCKVYRFYDHGTVYFTKCNEVIWQQDCGKSCVCDMNNRTNGIKK